MKLGYVGLSDESRSKSAVADALDRLKLADRLGFAVAYLPKCDPARVASWAADVTGKIEITLDATAFGPKAPSDIIKDVRQVHDQLDGRLNLGLQMCGPDASSKCKADAQAFETLFSQSAHSGGWHIPSRFPMKPPSPQIYGLPMTGTPAEARLAAARGYAPMTPSWLAVNDLARVWPNIVAGATSAVRRACPSLWQVNRLVVVHDDCSVLDGYLYGPQSPVRAYVKRLAKYDLIDGDLDAFVQRVVIAGPPSKVAQDILSLREIVGQFGTLNLIDCDAAQDGLTRETMVRLAEEVMPMVENADVRHLKSLERT